MTGFEVYQKYIALKQHFTSDYDYFKYNGKTTVTWDSFCKRRDKFHFEKLARKYPNESDIVDYLVANFITDETWIGDLCSDKCQKTYNTRKAARDALAYTFQEDLKKLKARYKKLDESIEFVDADTYHPYLFKLYLGGHVNIETVLILNSIYRFIPLWTERLKDDPIYQSRLRIMKKYRYFLKFKADDFQNIVFDVFKD